MSIKNSKGKQQVFDITSEMHEQLIDPKLFPLSLFQANPFAQAKLSYADFETVTYYIILIIRNFFKDRSDEHEMQWLLQPAFNTEEELIGWVESTNPTNTILNYRTLYRSIENKYLSIGNMAILKTFLKINQINQQEQELLSKYHGLYLEIGIHTTTNAFQISLLYIKDAQNASLKYDSIRRNAIIEDKLKILLTDDGKAISLTNRSAKYSHFFHLHLGREANNDDCPYIQGVQTYVNQTYSVSSVSLFYRLNNIDDPVSFFSEFKPERRLESLMSSITLRCHFEEFINLKIPGYLDISVLDNIQYFLVNKGSTQTTNTSQYLRHDFSKILAIEPSYLRTQSLHYASNLSFIGEYELYFHERFPADKEKAKKLKNSSFVGKARFIIYKDAISGIIKSELVVLKASKEEQTIEMHFRGHQINHKLNNSQYLVFNLYLEPSMNRFINLVLKADNDYILSGIFNITYISEGELGAGVCYAKRIKAGDDKVNPESIDPKDWNDSYLSKEKFDFLSKEAKSIAYIPNMKD